VDYAGQASLAAGGDVLEKLLALLGAGGVFIEEI
jgi:hypothetical protein